MAIPRLSALRERLWYRRYERMRREVSNQLKRVEKERVRLGRDLHRLNWHLVQGMPADVRDDPEARSAALQEWLDPELERVEKETGWRFPYAAEPDPKRRYAEHRYTSEPVGKK